MRTKTYITAALAIVAATTILGCSNKAAMIDPSRISEPQNVKDVIGRGNSTEIVAETEYETHVIDRSASDADSRFMSAVATLEAYDSYCKQIEGISVLGEKSGKLFSSYKNLIVDSYLRDDRNEQSKKGIAPYPGWFKCISDKDGYEVDINNGSIAVSTRFMVITHDRPQEQGYAFLRHINENKGEGIDVLDRYRFSPFSLARMIGFCMAREGDLYMQSIDTNGKALKATDFLREYTSLSGKRSYHMDVDVKAWCVDTADVDDEFTAEAKQRKFTSRSGGFGIERVFMTTEGVDKSEIIKERP